MLNHDQEISGKTCLHQAHSARALRSVVVVVVVVVVAAVVAVVVVVVAVAVAVAVVVAAVAVHQVAEIRMPPPLGWREPHGDSADE